MRSDVIQRDRAGTLRELLVISVPLVISSGSTAMMYVVDRILLSWHSVDSMAAALPAGVLHWNLAALALGTVTYANAFIGQYEGAGQHHRVGPVLWQGIYFSLIASALALLCVPAAPAMFAWFDHDGAVQALELRYFRILCCGMLPLLLDGALSSFYSGRGKTTTVMVVNTLGMLINIGLDYLLIFGKLGLPAMGIDGAAVATVIAFTAITLMYVAAMAWDRRNRIYCLWSGRGPDRELFVRLLRFGLPSGMQQFLDIACWNVFIQLIGRLGTRELSATVLVFNLNGLVFIPLLGLGTAVTVLVGHRIGEGRPRLAVRTTWLALALAAAYVVPFVFVYAAAPDVILRPYGLADHPGVRAGDLPAAVRGRVLLVRRDGRGVQLGHSRRRRHAVRTGVFLLAERRAAGDTNVRRFAVGRGGLSLCLVRRDRADRDAGAGLHGPLPARPLDDDGA